MPSCCRLIELARANQCLWGMGAGLSASLRNYNFCVCLASWLFFLTVLGTYGLAITAQADERWLRPSQQV